MTLKNNRAPLLSIIKLYASFHHHMWIQTGVTVRKWLSWVVTSVTLNFDLWPWPFGWTLPWSLVITPGNFMMIRWWDHSQKGVTDRRMDRRTETTIHRAAWSQLKTFHSQECILNYHLQNGCHFVQEEICKIYQTACDINSVLRCTHGIPPEKPWKRQPDLAVSRYKWTPVSCTGVAAFHLAACVCTSSSDTELIGAD